MIIVDFFPDGKLTISVKGVKGKECVEVTKDLEEALGIIKQERKTQEYYQKPQYQKIHLKH
jgi:hypothetical protein